MGGVFCVGCHTGCGIPGPTKQIPCLLRDFFYVSQTCRSRVLCQPGEPCQSCEETSCGFANVDGNIFSAGRWHPAPDEEARLFSTTFMSQVCPVSHQPPLRIVSPSLHLSFSCSVLILSFWRGG